MARSLFAIATVLGLCAAAPADCRRVVRVNHAVAVVDHVVATPVVAAVYTPVAVAAYSVGYSAPDQTVQLQIENLRLQNQLLEAKLQAVVQNQQRPAGDERINVPPDKAPKNGGEHPGLGVLRNNCASCHEDSVAKQKGDGFVLFEGNNLAKLVDGAALRTIGEVYHGRMPKGGKPLSDEDVAQVLSLFDTKGR